MYADENDGQFPTRFAPFWMTRLQKYYADLRLLKCPSDPVGVGTTVLGTPGNPDAPEYAPRSYLMNGWNDYIQFTLDGARWQEYRKRPAGGRNHALYRPSMPVRRMDPLDPWCRPHGRA